MERKTGSFFIYAALLFLGLILIRSFFPGNENQDPNQNDPSNNVAEAQDENKLADEQDGTDDESSDETTEPNQETAGDESSQPTTEEQVAEVAPPKFYTIGNLDDEGRYKNLVTLSSLGATVRRVELNARRRNGKLLYQDLEDEFAYIGRLELTEDDETTGVQINVVGPGTPADQAGLKVGDWITAVQGEPVDSPQHFNEILGEIKAGTEIVLDIKSESGTRDKVSVKTMRAPLQIISPIPSEQLLEDDEFYKAFQLTLHKFVNHEKWPDLDKSLKLDNWEAEVVGQDEVRFKKTISKKTMQDAGLDGPIEITKIFRAVSTPADDTNASERFHHFFFDLEIKNLAAEPQQVFMQLIGPTGTTIEGWWYQHKIHGRASAVFYTAGARDIVISTSGDSYSFWGGPEIISTYNDNEFQMIVDRSLQPAERQLNYAAVDTQYFTVALLPTPDQETPLSYFSGFAAPASTLADKKKEQRKTDITFRLYTDPIVLPPAGSDDVASFKQSYEVFVGPKESHVLDAYGLNDVRTFGWFAIFSKPLIWLLHLFYSIIPNYGLAIIMLTFLVRIGMMPISRKAAKNALMMQYLQPEIKKIAEKYKDDFQKRGEAQNALLKKYNVHPLGGCLLMFVQLPIFIGLYRGISVDTGLRDKALIPGLSWCDNLAGPDQLFYWGDWGLPFLFSETGWLGPYFNILPIVTVVLFLIQQKMFMPPATDDQQKMMQSMMKYMMLFMGVLFFKVSSGLCIYFITSSLWGVFERKLIPKPELPDHLKNKSPDDSSEKEKKTKTEKPSKVEPAYDRTNKKLEERRKFDRERRKKLKDR